MYPLILWAPLEINDIGTHDSKITPLPLPSSRNHTFPLLQCSPFPLQPPRPKNHHHHSLPPAVTVTAVNQTATPLSPFFFLCSHFSLVLPPFLPPSASPQQPDHHSFFSLFLYPFRRPRPRTHRAINKPPRASPSSHLRRNNYLRRPPPFFPSPSFPSSSTLSVGLTSVIHHSRCHYLASAAPAMPSKPGAIATLPSSLFSALNQHPTKSPPVLLCSVQDPPPLRSSLSLCHYFPNSQPPRTTGATPLPLLPCFKCLFCISVFCFCSLEEDYPLRQHRYST
ncbi:uncharacterized protein LOC107646972 [Arachis ipaensis]|uniref:uncharacterized protein LOC107646972 n=1 Tax=Arachis ipaensis TaxID=130454 RepID=UPI0007AF6967|nr:uncharacterized protein LOC107646972 [Arachis ipaensis]